MPIKTIDMVIDVPDNRAIRLQLPPEIAPGRHRMIAIIDEPLSTENILSSDSWTFPVVQDAQWPENYPVSREEMYGDDGR